MSIDIIKLSDKTVGIVENNGFSLQELTEQDSKYYVEINQSTPAGEDWWETVWFDGTDEGFSESIKNRSNNFDVDEEAEIFIKGRGTNGVPGSIKDLIEDAEWKKQILEELADQLAVEL